MFRRLALSLMGTALLGAAAPHAPAAPASTDLRCGQFIEGVAQMRLYGFQVIVQPGGLDAQLEARERAEQMLQAFLEAAAAAAGVQEPDCPFETSCAPQQGRGCASSVRVCNSQHVFFSSGTVAVLGVPVFSYCKVFAIEVLVLDVGCTACVTPFEGSAQDSDPR